MRNCILSPSASQNLAYLPLCLSLDLSEDLSDLGSPNSLISQISHILDLSGLSNLGSLRYLISWISQILDLSDLGSLRSWISQIVNLTELRSLRSIISWLSQISHILDLSDFIYYMILDHKNTKISLLRSLLHIFCFVHL